MVSTIALGLLQWSRPKHAWHHGSARGFTPWLEQAPAPNAPLLDIGDIATQCVIGRSFRDVLQTRLVAYQVAFRPATPRDSTRLGYRAARSRSGSAEDVRERKGPVELVSTGEGVIDSTGIA